VKSHVVAILTMPAQTLIYLGRARLVGRKRSKWSYYTLLSGSQTFPCKSDRAEAPFIADNKSNSMSMFN
jgi:hypothetical protein